VTGWCCCPGLAAAAESGFFPCTPCAYAAALTPTTNDNSVKLKTRAPFIGRASKWENNPEVRTVGPKKARSTPLRSVGGSHAGGNSRAPCRYRMVKEDC
jgi:hypothetical protein